jgi:hypothetical protein
MQQMTDRTFPEVPTGARWPRPRRRPASAYLFELPYAAQLAAFESFTLAQAEAQKGTTLRAMAAEASQTHGMPSSR